MVFLQLLIVLEFRSMQTSHKKEQRENVIWAGGTIHLTTVLTMEINLGELFFL